MAVDVVRVVPVVFPFLQLSPASRLQRQQSVELFLQTVGERLVLFCAKDGRGTDDVGEQVVYQFIVHCHSGCRRGVVGVLVLGRETGANHPVGVARVAHHYLVEEARRLFHRGVSVGEEFLVACIQVMLPQMLAEPRPSGGPQAGRGLVDSPGHTP